MRQPKELYLLALSEMGQRFAFWGTGYLLTLFLTQFYKYSSQDADGLYGIFTGVAFILPLFGGFLADRIGYKKPVVLGCISTALGCFILATGLKMLLLPGLLFTALGAGLFTPGIYATLGTLFHHSKKARQGGFTIYYALVNIGVFAALIILGAIQQAHHWKTTFLIAGAVQLLAIYPYLKVVNNKQIQKNLALDHHKMKANRGPKPKKGHSEKEAITIILAMSLVSIVFWLSYTQFGASILLFIQNDLNRSIGSFTIPSTWFNSVESLTLVLLAYPMAYLYSKGKSSPYFKTALSFVALGFCFILFSLAAKVGANSLPIVLGGFVLMALGETLLAPIGLALVTEFSPKKYTAMLVGFWYVCIGLAFYMGGLFAGLSERIGYSQLFKYFAIGNFSVAALMIGFLLWKVREVNSK